MPNHQPKNLKHFKTTYENSSRSKPTQRQENQVSASNHYENDSRSLNSMDAHPKAEFSNKVQRSESHDEHPRDGLICVICCHKTDLICVGPCDHPVCFECATRMRVLCLSVECPICRAENEFVYVVHFRPDVRNYYADVITGQRNMRLFKNFLTHKYGVCFESAEARDSVFDILAHVCAVCREEVEFQSFDELARHMRRVHELFYCELCVEFLKLFSWERKCYTRHDLAQHKRIGDADDKSHKGHPLCKFCDQRFLDQDHLYKHLRKDHYFCHFCDVDGKNMFYTGIKQLKDHLKNAHFLCEIGQCRNEEMGVSFRHEIDFKAHKANVHGREMPKSDLKKELQVNVAFNYGPKPLRDRIQGEGGARQPQPRQGHSSTGPNEQERKRRGLPQPQVPIVDHGASLMAAASRPQPMIVQNSLDPNFQLTSDEFPSLDGGRTSNAGPSTSAMRASASTSMANIVDRVYLNPAAPARTNFALVANQSDDFPALGRTAGRRDAARRKEKLRTPDVVAEKTVEEKNVVDEKPQIEKENFMMIDDDEHHKNWAPKKLQKDKVKKEVTATSDAQTSEFANLWGKPKVAGLSQAEFPSLAVESKPPKVQKSNDQWSKTVLTEKKKVAPKKPENQTMSLKSIGVALEMESLPSTKAVVRKISTEKREKTDENSKNLQENGENLDQGPENSNVLPPPPGFSSFAPPPGFANSKN